MTTLRLARAVPGVVALLGFAICFGEGRASQKEMAHPKGVQLFEPPKRTGKYTRYWIATHLTAHDVHGVAFPGPKRLKFFQAECSNFDVETSRHFRLPDGTHVLAMYDVYYYYSLVFIYTVPPKGDGKAPFGVNTKNGSLEAWILRHEGHEYAEHYLPLEPWKRFLALPLDKRAQSKQAFRLEGTIERVREDEFGLVTQMSGINLSTSKPLPPFIGFLDFREKETKKFYDWSLQRLDVNQKIKAEAKEEYDRHMQQLRYWRENPATDRALIEGWLHGGWASPPWNIKFP